MDPIATTLRSSDGSYVCAEAGGGREVVANRLDAGPWETWRVHTYDDGRVSLQSHDGHYLTAELDDSVQCKAVQSGEWERFTLEVREGAGVAFKSYHGK